jgi:sterol 3beta-glucosyltransferase
MVAAAGAGPSPIDHKSLDVPALVNAIQFCLLPNTLKCAQILADRMRHENGVKAAVDSFHRNLPIKEISCDLMPEHPATWYWKKGKNNLKLSHQAASNLVENHKISPSDLTMYV